MSNTLDTLLEHQRQLEQHWGRECDPNDPEAVSRYVREVILCIEDELHEVLAEVHWKPWKKSRGIKDITKYREELADVLHFFLNLYLVADMTGEDILNDYLAKHDTNIQRTKSEGYINS